MANTLREQVDAIVLQQSITTPIRSIDPRRVEAHRQAESVAALSRAVHAATRAARSKTIVERAAQLGVGIVRPLEASVPGRTFQERISEDDRRLHGYGDLPDTLIRNVERSIGALIPEHSSFTSMSLRFAAAAMHVVRQNPTVLLHDIWGKIAEDEMLLATLPRELKPTDVVALEDAVQIAQYHSAEYFTANPQQGE